MRFLMTCALCFAPLVAWAQDSVFRDYQDYARFVDRHVMERDFVTLIQRLGGRDEYTKEELSGIQRQFQGIYSGDFEKMAVLKEVDLGGGFSTEMRSYWGAYGYVWFGAMLHDTGRELVVINFRLNSNPGPVMELY
ncbi:hypothetical protein ACS3SW_02515 [Roseobacteraceae bacterium S113]